MAWTPTQKKWAVGEVIAAGALAIGYGLLHRRSGQAGSFSESLRVRRFQGGRFQGDGFQDGFQPEYRHRKKFRHHEENERGEYGRKKKHHHRVS